MAVTALQQAILCSANAVRWVITAYRVLCAACKHSCCGNIDTPTATEEEGKHIYCTKRCSNHTFLGVLMPLTEENPKGRNCNSLSLVYSNTTVRVSGR